MKFGMISVNLNSTLPVVEYMRKEYPSIFCHHYMDTGLQYFVKEEGRVTEQSIQRLEDMLHKAVSDNVDVIILTCTVFSPYIERIQSDIPDIPIVCADRAMIENAILRGYDIAHIYTFGPSLSTSRSVFEEICRKTGSSVLFNPIFAEGAFEALAKGDKDSHDALIEEKIRQAEEAGFKTIILSQMSMSYLKRPSAYEGCVILSSPESAIKKAIEIAGKA